MYNEAVGEFWYELSLVATKPSASDLDHMECELGRHTTQTITISNPTEESLKLVPLVSNTNNFRLERDSDKPIFMRCHSKITIPLTFMPSNLGTVDHRCKISFMCEQLGEIEFNVTGGGTLPQAQDLVSITSMAGSNTTLIIPFRNPLDIPVLVDVYLKDYSDQMISVLEAFNADVTETSGSPFCMLLRQNKGLRLGPKSTLDIPLSFAPEDMRMFEANITVSVMKEDHSPWIYICTDDNGLPLSNSNSGQLHEIKWVYPIRGYPELTAPGNITPANLHCKARDRVDERFEVTLSGVAPSNGGSKRGLVARAKTPKDAKPETPEGIVVGETLNLADEFTYEMQYDSCEAKSDLEPAIGLNLVRSYRDKTNGQVALVFSIVYAPAKQMKHGAKLLVQAATGGLWRFPLTFSASEPDPDDLIIVESAALNTQSAVGFKLFSPVKHPVAYTASFVAGSDPEFDIIPSKGELLPEGTNGTLLKITFLPKKYGKLYQGTLMVSAEGGQWTYSVRGVIPEYRPPLGVSCRPMAGPHLDPRRRLNRVSYLQENLKLNKTAVSSPMKGSKLYPPQQLLANSSSHMY